jgi:hypothetical protein
VNTAPSLPPFPPDQPDEISCALSRASAASTSSRGDVRNSTGAPIEFLHTIDRHFPIKLFELITNNGR